MVCGRPSRTPRRHGEGGGASTRAGNAQARRGRGATETRRAGAGRIVLALDIGGTKLAAGLVTRAGELLAFEQTPSQAADGPDAVIDRLVALGRSATDAAALHPRQIAAVGVACGGPLDPETGIITNALNNPGWVNVPLGRILTQAFQKPVWIENDANATALAEHRFGAGRGVRNMVYLTVSTGVGGGVIADGRLYRGEDGNGGEIGHLSVDHDGRPCHCGGRGCLEAYASGTSIAERARESLRAEGQSLLLEQSGGLEGVTAESVAAAARLGDRVASRVWDETVEILAAGVASVINVFNPGLVVLGGGVTRAGDDLIRPLRRAALARAMPPLAATVDIVASELGERGGVLGAACVAFDRLGADRLRVDRLAGVSDRVGTTS